MASGSIEPSSEQRQKAVGKSFATLTLPVAPVCVTAAFSAGSHRSITIDKPKANAVSALGFAGSHRSRTMAKARGLFNGFGTWARYGYSAMVDRRVAERAVRELPGLRRASPIGLNVQKIMAVEGGPAWWRANGTSVHLTCAKAALRGRSSIPSCVPKKARAKNNNSKEKVEWQPRKQPAIPVGILLQTELELFS